MRSKSALRVSDTMVLLMTFLAQDLKIFNPVIPMIVVLVMYNQIIDRSTKFTGFNSYQVTIGCATLPIVIVFPALIISFFDIDPINILTVTTVVFIPFFSTCI